MADRTSERLPIKVILPKQGTERKNTGGGSPPKPFRKVDEKYRSGLVNQVSAFRDAFTPELQDVGGAPVRVRLIAQATAKSHRPEKIFSDQTCPIIGAGKQGELFVQGSTAGLNRLQQLIQSGHSDAIVKEISSIESIEPVTPHYKRRGQASLDVLKRSPRGSEGFISKVKLFHFDDIEINAKAQKRFFDLCDKRDIQVSRKGYAEKSLTYSVECKSVEDLEEVSKLIAIRSVAPMPLVRIVKPQSGAAKPFPSLPSRPAMLTDIPTVVVVDSGIATNIPELESWVMGRISDVAPQERDPDHGTFVAGLICYGGLLNPTIGNIDSTACGVFDLQVIPNADPSKGDTGTLSEQELLQSLQTALQLHANKYKVWNLSLGTDEVCSLDEFSSLAEEFDNLQEQYGVSFVISAGNFNSPPLLAYPRSGEHLTTGRITSPADSVLGISVGSVSHVDYQTKGPKQNELSAFSRHGAGPNHIIKPDLVHFGGACSLDGSHMSGIKSLVSTGLVEDIGTSFSAPLVSRGLAQIYHQVTPAPSPVLARAILTHHARDPRTQLRVPEGDENFFGFGIPSSVSQCLECTPHTSTLIFDDILRPGFFLEWDSFPYPKSLYRDGKFFGEIWMTIALAPSRGARWGSEYCESHIEANFGVYRDVTSRATGEVQSKFVGLVPPEFKNPGILYESYQVEALRKWAPVRTYHGLLSEKGERGTRWRLKLRLLTRHGEELESPSPQPFSLIVTISDPLRKAPVYDEMAQIIRNRFQSQNLSIRDAIRVQAQT